MKKVPRVAEPRTMVPGHPDQEHPLRFPKKASTKAMLAVSQARGGLPDHMDAVPGSGGGYESTQKLHNQSAGAKRAGDNRYPSYPDASVSNDMESTGSSWAGSKKGTR